MLTFRDSGLPNNKLVEDAFNYSYANMLAQKEEVMVDFTKQVKKSLMQSLRSLEIAKEVGEVTEEEYKQEKEGLEKMFDEQMKIGPQIVEKELTKVFMEHRVAPSQELQKYGERATPEALAAILLLESVRSPVDYMNIVKKFGEPVGRLLGEVQHLDVYPLERAANVAKFGSDTKRAYLALLINNLTGIMSQIKMVNKIKPGQKIVVAGGMEESMFNSAKILRGNDKKLDQRFVSIFNETAVMAGSPFRIEVDAKGALELIKGNTPPVPPRPPKPPTGTKPVIGDDVF